MQRNDNSGEKGKKQSENKALKNEKTNYSSEEGVTYHEYRGWDFYH